MQLILHFEYFRLLQLQRVHSLALLPSLREVLRWVWAFRFIRGRRRALIFLGKLACDIVCDEPQIIVESVFVHRLGVRRLKQIFWRRVRPLTLVAVLRATNVKRITFIFVILWNFGFNWTFSSFGSTFLMLLNNSDLSQVGSTSRARAVGLLRDWLKSDCSSDSNCWTCSLLGRFSSLAPTSFRSG